VSDANPKAVSDTLRRANVANIVKKLNAGKTLTRGELELVAEHADSGGKTTKELAERWGIEDRQAQRHRKDGVPLDNDADMVRWYTSLPTDSQRKLTPEFSRRIHEVGAKLRVMPGTGAEWEADTPKESLADIKEARDFAAFRFKLAAKANDRLDMKAFADLLSTFEGVVHDAELRAKKLGLDAGELLPRPEIERILWALAYWLLRSTDQHLDAISAKLTKLSAGLDDARVRAVLEPELLSQRFLGPFAQASKLQNGVGLPAWVVAKMREAAGDFLEGGEMEFDKQITK
jgi:hypothetical protein